ncbi:MAG: AAA family ATPase [Rhodobacteraceae bacterium]|nr:AAA family ATPase [Paracoccaceae bacterium]
MAARVHITGAAGSGTSALGRALAEALNVPHLDTDSYFWAPSEPPFTQKRPVEDRLALIAADQVAQGEDGGWVLSGSLDGWGELALGGLDAIIFLSAPTPIRLARLRKREAEKFGARIRPGGDMYHNHIAFLKWAASYDEPYFSGRSLARHREWLAGRSEPVIEVSGAEDLDGLVVRCLQRLR